MNDLLAFAVMMFFGLTSLILLLLSYMQSRKALALGVPNQRLNWSRYDIKDNRCPPEFAAKINRTNWLITINLIAFILSVVGLLSFRVI